MSKSQRELNEIKTSQVCLRHFHHKQDAWMVLPSHIQRVPSHRDGPSEPDTMSLVH
jgi:hypothetical protein